MNAPLDCTETFRRLDDYLDRELAPGKTAAVAAHLERCAACAEEFAVERDLLASIRAKLARIAVPGDLVAKVRERLERD